MKARGILFSLLGLYLILQDPTILDLDFRLAQWSFSFFIGIFLLMLGVWEIALRKEPSLARAYLGTR